jgi:nucleolar complex protein 3
VLEGLAKFAHLINIDFFEDLLAVLKKISLEQHQAYISGKDDASTTPISALHCIVAALELMESMGGAIEMDMTDFYTALYTQMNRLAVRPGSFDQFRLSKSTPRNEIELTLQGLKFMLKKHRKMPLDRVGAFMKRLSILALSTPSNCTMANLFTIREAAMVLYSLF